MRLTLGIAAVAATLAAASPAAAQVVESTASAQARGLVLTSESLTRVRDLDFGAVTVATSMTTGDITIAAQETLNRTLDTGITALSGTAHSAKFVGYGVPGETVTLTLTEPTFLQGPGTNTIDADLFLDAGGTSRIVGSSATFEAFVGGTFTLTGSQAAGLYTADFELTAEYP